MIEIIVCLSLWAFAWAYAWAVMTDNYQVFGWLGNPSVSENIITMNAGTTDYKIHLNSCMKITSGTGDYANPYILEYIKNDKCP